MEKLEKIYLAVPVDDDDDDDNDDLTSMPMISIDNHRGDVKTDGVEKLAEVLPDNKSHCYKALETNPGKLNLLRSFSQRLK